jgi:hypothetical protein
MVHSIVVCNACTSEIRFPTTTPSRRVMNQMSSTPIEIPRNILCPHCKHVLLYEAPEFNPSGVENTDPHLPPGDWVHVCIAVKCAQEGCESHVQLHSCDNVGVEQHEEKRLLEYFPVLFL